MSAVLVPSLQVKRSLLIRRRRELPIRGDILAKLGAQVSERDTVAAAYLPGEMRIVRVADELGVEGHEVKEALRVKEGDTVNVGDLLAERRGLFGFFRSRVNSTFSGTVELISHETGHVALRAAPVPLQLSAFLRGEVVEIDPERAVVIENRVTFIQGIFGIGGERSGVLNVLDIPKDEVITEKHLESAQSGQIIVGGCRPSCDVLHAAAKKGVVGLIVGSLDDKALSDYLGYELGIALTGDEDVPLTVIMTEGFGTLSIADHTLQLLKECSGMPASINGATQVRAGALRPEIIVFRDGLQKEEQNSHAAEMCPGVRVRIIRVPYFGQYGAITELPHELGLLDTGGRARVLKVKLDSGSEVIVPRANIELLA